MEKIKLVIDSRESALYQNISNRDLDKYKDYLELQSEQLELGDIHIHFRENLLVFERKSISDLLSSIKDGRYKEQKARLLSNITPNNITYIIEGDDITSSRNNNRNVLSSVYMHSIYRDGIHIVFTKNIEETATFLLTLCIKIIENPNKFIKDNMATTSYVDNIKLKSKKIDNIDTRTCYLMQLSQIPHISLVIAKNIEKFYPTLREFLKALDDSDEKLKLLCKIDKIGKDKAGQILKYLGYL